MLSLDKIAAFRLEIKSCKDFFLNKFSTNQSTQIYNTGHVIYNPAYTYKFQLKTTMVGFSIFMLIKCGELGWMKKIPKLTPSPDPCNPHDPTHRKKYMDLPNIYSKK